MNKKYFPNKVIKKQKEALWHETSEQWNLEQRFHGIQKGVDYNFIRFNLNIFLSFNSDSLTKGQNCNVLSVFSFKC